MTLWPHADLFSAAPGGPGGEACLGLKRKLLAHFLHFLKLPAAFPFCSVY